jgi:hypothetical protein
MSKRKRRKNKSVAPFGLTLPHTQKRLDQISDKREKEKDPEHIIMKLWELQNTREISLNFGLVPIDSILHRCTVECGIRKSFVGTPNHEYTDPDENEIRIINATVQWFATSCGRAFLHKFQNELKNIHQK